MNCIICYEDFSEKNQLIKKHCKCNYEIHLECFNLVKEKNKYLCPICRIKDNNIKINIYSIFNETNIFIDNLNHLLIYLVGCGFFGFIMALLLSLIVTMFYILPKFFYLIIYEKINGDVNTS